MTQEKQKVSFESQEEFLSMKETKRLIGGLLIATMMFVAVFVPMRRVMAEEPAGVASAGNKEPIQETEAIQGTETAQEIGTVQEFEPEESETEQPDPEAPEQNINSWRHRNGGCISSEESEMSAYQMYTSDSTYPHAWEKVDGKYMNSRGEVVEGVVARGIDVSQWQETIDWEKVKNDGVDFAIIRCGYGENKTHQDDKKFAYNVKECIRLKIPFGVYLYSYAMSAEAAADEASHALRLLRENGVEPSDMTYPFFYDLENETGKWDQRTLSAEERGNIAETFCTALGNAGYAVGIYANTNWFTNYLTDQRFQKWDKWVAQYNYKCTYTGNYKMWQCTSSGIIDGIPSDSKGKPIEVDINFDFYYASGGNSNESQPPTNGLYVKDGKTYFYENGIMARNKEAVVNGQWKWFDADGTMAVSKDVYLATGNKWVRYNANGDMVKGWDTNQNGTYYFDLITGEMYKGVKKINNKFYYFYQITGIMVVAYSKELVVDNEWRWFDADGTIAVSKDVYLPIGNKWVRYNAQGAMVKGWDRTPRGTYYFDLITGEMLKGWHWLSEGLFYFNPITGIRQ